MKIKKINLPKVQCFPCRKSDVKRVFENINDIEFEFGRSDIYVPRYTNLKLEGIVVGRAGILTTRELAYVKVFALKKDEYDQKAIDEFSLEILPNIRKWVCRELMDENYVFGESNELFITWKDGKHHLKKWCYS